MLRPAEASSGPEIGPYTEIQLPLEDLAGTARGPGLQPGS